MLSSADAALIGRDPRLLALPLLLDADALTGWLRRSMDVTTVRRRYLRYKPGTSGVLAIEVDGRTLVMTGYEPDVLAAKLAKTRHRSPAGAVLVVDRRSGVVLTTPAADRDLPALARLGEPPAARKMLRGLLRPQVGPVGAELPGLALQQVSYKPQRRWVAVASTEDDRKFVVRCYRPGDVQHCVRATIAAELGAPRTPAVLGVDQRKALVALEFLAGRTLGGDASAPDLTAAGAALGALHSRPPAPGVGRPDPLGVQAVRDAARALSGLLPQLSSDIRAVTVAIVAALTRSPGPTISAHGDFSLDQVVIGQHGRAALIDLDRAGPGQAAGDIGSAAAAEGALALTRMAEWSANLEPSAVLRQVSVTIDGLTSGYSAHHAEPERRAIRAQTAAHLLRRSVEPFRLGQPHWSAQAAVLLTAAGSLAADDHASATHRRPNHGRRAS